MKDLLDKLSSYNIFNYLLPGVLFAVFVDAMTSIRVIQEDIVIGVFVYYFMGSVVSRIGSLIIEPILKKIKFIEFASYVDFVKAANKDPKLEILSEANNMYRTLSSLMLCIGFIMIYDQATQNYPLLSEFSSVIVIVFLGILFLMSYRKQTAYISSRIEANKP